ncbi:hypothetical protein ACIEGK_27795 [Citrobacter freundii]|uniref:hypothetical protein n=1 Tax=Citrobacter freundii complex TaxID=1344959 RepID=UPI0021123494|nr:hypothetical protein [Citrobacter portucalensis]MCQ6311680.1 hypothetical protein [Citrobacter portucalensis]
MTFLTEEAIVAAAKKLHVDITGINAISTLASHFMITEGFYLLRNKSAIKRRLVVEIKAFLGQSQGMKVAK